MANFLHDKIKNDYSKKNLIVADTDSFYKAASVDYGEYTSEQNYNEKIEISNTRVSFLEDNLTGQGKSIYPGYHSPVDPFRQSIGKMYGLNTNMDIADPAWYNVPSLYDLTTGLPTSEGIFLPYTYKSAPAPQFDSGIHTYVELEDVTDLWQEIFPKGSYSDSLNIPRKATRLMIRFNKIGIGTGNTLQNRLSMLSLLSDIQRKNMVKAYIDQSKQGAPTLDVPDPGTMVDPAQVISANEDMIADITYENMLLTSVVCAIEQGINWDLGKPDVDLHNYWWQNNTYSGFFPYKNTEVDPNNPHPQGQTWHTDHSVPWDDKIHDIYGGIVGDYANPESGVKDLSDKLYLKHIQNNEEFMDMYVHFTVPYDTGGPFDSGYPMGEQSRGWDVTYFRYISNIWEEDKLSYGSGNPCEEGGEYPVKTRLEWIKFISEKLTQYEDDPAISALDKGPGLNRFTLPKFGLWCLQQIEYNKNSIGYLQGTNENLQESWDNYGTAVSDYEEAKETYDIAIADWLATTLLGSITFEGAPYPGNDSAEGNYNYKALLTKEFIDTSNYKQALGLYGELTIYEQDQLYQTIDPIALGFLNEAIKDSRMDMFYNFKTEDYNYNATPTNNDNRYYRNSSFFMDLPMTTEALSRVDDPSTGKFVIDIKPQYNYYSPYYELLTKQESYKNKTGAKLYLHETYLPNIYDTPVHEDGTASEFHTIDAVDGNTDQPIKTVESIEDANWTHDVSKFRFEKFANNILNCVNVDSPWNPKKANIIVDQRDSNYIQRYEPFKLAFPFCVNIALTDKYPGDPAIFKEAGQAEKFVNFTKLFNDTGLTLTLMQSWISNFFPRAWFSFNTTHGYQNAQTFDPVDKSKIIRAKAPEEVLIGAAATMTNPNLQTQKYYDPLDPSPEYNVLSEGVALSTGGLDNVSAELCKEHIYKVKEKITISELVESQAAADSYQQHNLLKYQGGLDGQEKMHREFDLNRWLDFFFNTKGGPSAEILDAKLGISDAIKSSSMISSKLELGADASADGNFGPPDASPYNATSQHGANFLGQYAELVDEVQMGYSAICGDSRSNGLPTAYSETLFYRILKTAVDFKGDPIAGHAQNIWIIRPSEPTVTGVGLHGNFNIMEYIDTQVKYGQAYEYQVFAYKIVVGSKYNFQFVNSINPIMPEEEPPEPDEPEEEEFEDEFEEELDESIVPEGDPISTEEATELVEEYFVEETNNIVDENQTGDGGSDTNGGLVLKTTKQTQLVLQQKKDEGGEYGKATGKVGHFTGKIAHGGTDRDNGNDNTTGGTLQVGSSQTGGGFGGNYGGGS